MEMGLEGTSEREGQSVGVKVWHKALPTKEVLCARGMNVHSICACCTKRG